MAYVFKFEQHPHLPKSHHDPKVIPSIEAEFYVDQYKMLHNIDCLAKKISGTFNRNPDPTRELAVERYQGFISVCEARSGAIAEFLFKRLLAEMARSLKPDDSMFLVQIWRLCGLLSGLHFPKRNNTNRFIFLRVFLQRVRHRVSQCFHEDRDHPLPPILDALLRILIHTPNALKWSPRHRLLEIEGYVRPLGHAAPHRR